MNYLKTEPGDMFWQCNICVAAVSKRDRPREEEEKRQLAALSPLLQFTKSDAAAKSSKDSLCLVCVVCLGAEGYL